MYFIKRSIFFSLFLVLFFYLPLQAYAADSNFSTAYDVTYSPEDTGLTHVVMKIGLTNKTTQFRASSYKIEVGFANISNVTAQDPVGQLKPTVTKTNNGYLLDTTFKKSVVGEGSTLHFTLAFDTADVAKKNGNIWEVNIPGINNPDNFSDFMVRVKPPDSFGNIAYVKPEIDSPTLVFTKEQLGKSGISIAFGDKQLYSFTLVYHLQNTNVYPIRTEIALPPTTNYQDVAIESIQPRPNNVIRDIDGNWLAQYSLSPSQKEEVTVTGKTAIHFTPQKELLTAEQKKLYTREQPYWKTSDEHIQAQAKKLKTAEAIYTYVINTLKYDFSRVTNSKPRLGAAAVLGNPNSAVCMEFTDLFIGLARAAGIPAREVNGYAYTENPREKPLSLVKDILHAWPEFYDADKQAWVMVDPTWGNTTNGTDYFHTLDFDHFAFVIKGKSSGYPIAAGGYKYAEDEEKKDVSVTFAKFISTDSQALAYTSLTESPYLSAEKIKATLHIQNRGQHMSPPLTASVTAIGLTPQEQKLAIPPIPPYGTTDISYHFQETPFLTNRSSELTIQLAGQKSKETIKITPFIFTKFTWRGGLVFALLSIIIFGIAYQTGRLPFLRRS